MQAQGKDDEEAALSLGATPFHMFRTVTLPNIRWALLYGVLLCNARAMGELARFRWCRGIFAASPTPCRCMSRSFTTNMP